ncbi:Hypothetical predicted protein, partial [Marmota monax]
MPAAAVVGSQSLDPRSGRVHVMRSREAAPVSWEMKVAPCPLGKCIWGKLAGEEGCCGGGGGARAMEGPWLMGDASAECGDTKERGDRHPHRH